MEKQEQKQYLQDILKFIGVQNYSDIIVKDKELRAIDVTVSIFNRIATDVAQIQAKHIRINAENDITEVAGSNLYRLLNLQPNNFMSAYDFYYKVIFNLYSDSNSFILIDRDDDNNVKALIPLNFQTVELLTNKMDDLFLKFYFKNGKHLLVSYDDIIHLRRLYNDEVFGDNPKKAIEYATRIIDVSNQAVINSLKESGKLKGIIKYQTMLNEDDIKSRKDTFVAEYLNSENVSGIGALDKGADFIELKNNYNLLDKEKLEFFRQNIYSFFNISPKIVKGIFNEEEYLAYFSTILQPIAIQMEQEFTRKIFTKKQIELRNKLVFDVKRILLSSIKNLTSFISKMQEHGILSINEAREILGFPKVDGGDTRRVTLNSETLDIDDETADEKNKKLAIRKYKKKQKLLKRLAKLEKKVDNMKETKERCIDE